MPGKPFAPSALIIFVLAVSPWAITALIRADPWSGAALGAGVTGAFLPMIKINVGIFYGGRERVGPAPGCAAPGPVRRWLVARPFSISTIRTARSWARCESRSEHKIGQDRACQAQTQRNSWQIRALPA